MNEAEREATEKTDFEGWVKAVFATLESAAISGRVYVTFTLDKGKITHTSLNVSHDGGTNGF